MTDKKEGSTQKPSEGTSEDQDLFLEGFETKKEITTSNQDGPGSGPEDISVSPAEGTFDFTNPLLKGKSPEEVERIFQAQQDAIREQDRELNRFHNERQRQPAAPTPTEEEPDYGDDFLAPRFKTLEQRLQRTLEKMVAPLNEATQRQGAQGVRDRLRGSLRHFTTLEPHINQLLRENDINPETASEQRLTMLYHTAVGLAAERGIPLEGSAPAPTPTASVKENAPMNIPQHRPSGAPLPPQNTGTPPRQLTEAERRLAREFFPSDNEAEKKYRELQDQDEGEVVKPGFSAEGW